MKAMSNHFHGFIAAILLAIIYGCSLDDRYHYTLSYRINNQTDNSVSGILIRDTIYHYYNRNPALEFEIEAGKTLELYTEDGGDGPNVAPISGYYLSTRELHINTHDSLIVIDVELNEKWERTTDRSTAIYTFLITSDLLRKYN